MKLLLISAGTVFVGLGIIGIFLPVLPTTPFLLLAATCYAKSSQKFYCWLMNNRWFGVYIRSYRQKKGMPLRIKVFTVALLWLTILLSVIFAVQSLVVRVILILIAIGVSTHIFSIKTLREK
ncbi:MAG: YbaN family protein [Dehalococcoidia bacterium]|nr:MAG: YbaN family protein [Dehalococcoidia bacterium]